MSEAGDSFGPYLLTLKNAVNRLIEILLFAKSAVTASCRRRLWWYAGGRDMRVALLQVVALDQSDPDGVVLPTYHCGVRSGNKRRHDRRFLVIRRRNRSRDDFGFLC